MEALLQGTIDRWFSAEYQASSSAEVDKIRAMIKVTPVAGFCGCARAISRLDVTERISAITIPTLVLVGEDDPGTPVVAHQVIHERIAGSQFVVLPSALHFSNVEQQERFNETLTAFLSAQDRGAQ